MLTRLFPKQFDNNYRGHALGLWLFALVMAMKATQAVTSIVDTRHVLATADGIPLDRFDESGAAIVIGLFAVVSFYLLLLPLQSIVVLIRYRAMVPFMYLLFLILQAGVRVLLQVRPIVIGGSHPFGYYVNLGILAVTIIGFVLSLRNRSDLPGQATHPGEVS